MKVLMISGDTSTINGEKGPFYYTLKGLSSHWNEIHILCKSDNEKRNELFDNVIFHGIQSSKLSEYRKIIQKAGELIEKHNIDLIVSHDYGLMINGHASLKLSSKFDVPFISEIHHIEGHPVAANLKDKIYFVLAKRYLKKIQDSVRALRIVNGNEIFKLLKDWSFPEDKIKIISSMYMDFDIFKPLDIEKEYDFMFCGRLSPNKGLGDFIEMVKRIKEHRPQLKTLIKGRGELKDWLTTEIQTHGLQNNIDLIEWVETAQDTAKLYNQAKILICCSTAEGGPRVTIEAMACETPVISTPVGLMPEVIKHGENGYLYQWDQDQLEEHILDLLNNEEKRMKFAKKSRIAVERFEYHQAIKNYADEYIKLAKI